MPQDYAQKESAATTTALVWVYVDIYRYIYISACCIQLCILCTVHTIHIHMYQHAYSVCVHLLSLYVSKPHLGCEHMGDSIGGPFKHEPAHQEAEEHHVREEGAEVHHLTMMKNTSARYYGDQGQSICIHVHKVQRQSISLETPS